MTSTRLVAALLMVGCQSGGAVEIQDVRIESTIEETRVEIDVANVGPSAAWIHVSPWRALVADEGDELVLEFAGDDTPPDQRPLHAFTPVIQFKRLARQNAQVFDSTHTIEITLGNDLGPPEQRAFVPDVPAVTVEIEWHDDDPGESVAVYDAPPPAGIASFTRTQ